MTDNTNHSIAHFAALKTAIVNGEEQLLTELLAGESMQALEKDYLVDLAKLNNNANIIKLLAAIPVAQ
ncbi:hypothetical protein [Paraglaciecola sp. 20A4]|uniref:hypothetical protein n=1 Tax=Paraglaciecola sp. 20A4 TaxID=2687288 RepID=UPI00140AC10F|nr:hypothetical protein [Paraglaciecola sp. 20A4]